MIRVKIINFQDMKNKTNLYRSILALVAVGVTANLVGCAGPSAYQKGVNDGYAQRQSDDAKRRYWASRKPKAPDQTTTYYVVDESGTQDAAGQTRPAGTRVAVPVAEPTPVR